MSQILLVVPLQPCSSRIVLVVFDLALDGIRDEWSSLNIISLLRHGNVDLIGDHLDSGSLEFLLDSVSEESITRYVSDVHDSLFRVGGGFNNAHRLVRDDGIDVSSVLGRELG